jgi:hypothetical protein
MTMPIWLRRAGQSMNQSSPTILSGIAVGGVIATAFLAAKATPKAIEKIQEARSKWTGSDAWVEGEKFPATEKVKACWKVYIPAAITGAATAGCIIGANQVGMRRNAALVGAYTLADTAFREYKQEVLEQLGAAKERKVTDAVAKKAIDDHPVSSTQVIITRGGEQLCYDSLTGRYFKSDIETIRQAENEINRRIVGGDMYASQNEFYALLGLANVIVGDELGWNLENFIELVFTSHLADDGQPCLAVGYARLPRRDYGKF